MHCLGYLLIASCLSYVVDRTLVQVRIFLRAMLLAFLFTFDITAGHTRFDPHICDHNLHCSCHRLQLSSFPACSSASNLVLQKSHEVRWSCTSSQSIHLRIGTRYYLATSRELKRLDAVSRSPIFAWFSESLAGLSTIRAFDQQEMFIAKNEIRLDRNQICYMPSISVNRWLAVRLELVGSTLIFVTAILAVSSLITKGVDAGLVGLVLSYALGITSTLVSAGSLHKERVTDGCCRTGWSDLQVKLNRTLSA